MSALEDKIQSERQKIRMEFWMKAWCAAAAGGLAVSGSNFETSTERAEKVARITDVALADFDKRFPQPESI